MSEWEKGFSIGMTVAFLLSGLIQVAFQTWGNK